MKRTGSKSSWAGGDEDFLPAQRTGRPQDDIGRGDDFVGLGEPPFADPAAREVALARFDEAHAARRERVEVLAHRFVREHVGVHRGREEHRRARGGVERRQKIVGDAVGELADHVGRRRRDDQQIDRRGERDVLDVGVGARLELIGDDAAARDRLERDGPDELRRRVRHHGDHVVPALLEPAHDLDRLVRPNPAGHAERDQCHCVTRLANYPITRLSNYSITRLFRFSSHRARSSRPAS